MPLWVPVYSNPNGTGSATLAPYSAGKLTQTDRKQTNAAGLVTYNFPTAYAANPNISVIPEDAVAGVSISWKVAALSPTSVTIQISKTSNVLGVLTLAATPGATWLEITAIEN